MGKELPDEVDRLLHLRLFNLSGMKMKKLPETLLLFNCAVQALGDKVLVKIKSAEEKTVGGILLPSTARSKPQGGEVVAVGEIGVQIVYSKYAGTELEFYGSTHLLLKEDDIVGILETDEVNDLKPINDRVLIKVG
ncbi:hypothetical protein IFM89_028568 [Coptis chinensis]|uniref:10 kDa chaperonin n=1 Tax=Coptis chinensis TaxID=261450 RepID=A0A835M4H6_9MAGN|nr:hypothetical protein IFM89_028568 [Coptis chinensis]